jgi:hypothetical protein
LAQKPCCATASAREIEQLLVGGRSIGLAQLDEIMDEVKELDLQSDNEIGDALLKKVKIFNYVPSSAAPDYLRALLEEYHRRG